MMQKTIRKHVEFTGAGLHTGKKTHLIFLPARPDSGIRFRRIDLPGTPEVPARIEYFKKLPIMCSCVANSNGAHVQLIEHIMACLNAFGIDNLIIEIDNKEPPFEDGSARFIVSMIEDAGLTEQGTPRRPIEIKTPLSFKEGEVELTAFPSKRFRATFFASYPHPMVGTQAYSLDVTPESFKAEIASAQTFCFEKDVEAMEAQGLLRGASEKSALVFGDGGLLCGTLHSPDEPVRHKLLDLIGDLYLLGAPLLAHITASRSGHFSHAEFVKLIGKETKL